MVFETSPYHLFRAVIDGLEVYYWHQPTSKMGRRPMGNHAVSLRVTPFLRIECKFWLTDDGWNGSCEQPSITVQAGSFEHAKSEMEIALGKYVESILREAQRSTGQAA
jgi:predicted RNase H-like HicB family nuclease